MNQYDQVCFWFFTLGLTNPVRSFRGGLQDSLAMLSSSCAHTMGWALESKVATDYYHVLQLSLLVLPDSPFGLTLAICAVIKQGIECNI